MICCNQRFSQWIAFCFLFTQVVGENSKESVIRCRVNPVFLQLANGNCTNLLWKKDSQNLAKFKNGKFMPHFGFENRAEVFPNGTLKLAMINNNDIGHYLLEVFNKEGINILKESIHLHTQVSQPEENSTCVMPGEAALVCAVEEGDSVYFHWNEVPSKNTNDQETVLIDLVCTVAVEKRSRSGGRVATVVCLAGTFVIIIFMLILKELKTINQNTGDYVVWNNTRREEMKSYTMGQSPPSTKATELEGKYNVQNGTWESREEYVKMNLKKWDSSSVVISELDADTLDLEKEYVDMRQTRAMVALDILDTSEKEYVDMRETRAMAALDISNTSGKDENNIVLDKTS
ncbi:hypothetical protein AOXY_G22073 [Acipenser oxyrinchus oxyrinchus]|uniref:Uncharacterized protein n=1 Tax=Acipenser oxyrinchus oxyrinchus TaxID=40147 RepID=A0AAD8CZ91_ACIOX|nr:hypothetical protein AOXY_G22073 [Acipenser oxyrinchus oxyrinchus]